MTRIIQGAPSYCDPEPDAAGIMNDPGAQPPVNDVAAELADESKRAKDLAARSEAYVLGQSADPELLNDGQEEVFSREEVESGRIEHAAEAGEAADQTEPPPR